MCLCIFPDETVRIESITTSKVHRKSEGNIIRTHTRRSLQNSSSESKKDQSPFGELYEMLKSEVESKKENGPTPVKQSSSSPKNVNVKRNFQTEAVSPATSKRESRRSQSSDSATARSKDTKVEPRAVSADRLREQSKSPSRGPRNSLTKQKQGNAVEVISSDSAQRSSTNEAAQDHAQTPRRRSGKHVSGSQEQEASVSPEKRSPRRFSSAEKIKVVDPVPSPIGSSPRTSRGRSVSHSTGIENQENSPLPVQSPKGRRSGSKGTPTKPAETEERQSPRRSRSAETIQVVDPVPSPAGSSRRTSRGQSVPHPAGIENQKNSPLPVQSPKDRRNASKGTPAKPVETEEKVKEQAQSKLQCFHEDFFFSLLGFRLYEQLSVDTLL